MQKSKPINIFSYFAIIANQTIAAASKLEHIDLCAGFHLSDCDSEAELLFAACEIKTFVSLKPLI